MAVPSPRISERLSADFGPSAPSMLSTLGRIPVSPQVDPERIHAAILLASRGNQSMFEDALEHAQEDWRDMLVRTGLADDHTWHDVVDVKFGENSPT
ncbi:hypothetical protein [Demequina oxidasica]|uniref:hypothetical protein n=1 Tax=Demequina oxidasica TaxID=676199 RepID=UPI000781424D|nr:hypothetical protein [Demequina oxidasica]